MIIKDLKVVYSEEQIAARVRELAQEINRLYKGEPLVVVCVLKGAFMFFTDLVRHLDMHPELDFVRLASYGDATHRGSTISFLIVEDIVDTGHTMDFLFRQLAARGAKSMRLAVLSTRPNGARCRCAPISWDLPCRGAS